MGARRWRQRSLHLPQCKVALAGMRLLVRETPRSPRRLEKCRTIIRQSTPAIGARKRWPRSGGAKDNQHVARLGPWCLPCACVSLGSGSRSCEVPPLLPMRGTSSARARHSGRSSSACAPSQPRSHARLPHQRGFGESAAMLGQIRHFGSRHLPRLSSFPASLEFPARRMLV